jgi:hypothetical protein
VFQLNRWPARTSLPRPGRDQRLAIRDRYLLAPAASDMQLLEPVQPLDAFVLHQLTGLAKLQVDHLDAIAPVTLSQDHDPRP